MAGLVLSAYVVFPLNVAVIDALPTGSEVVVHDAPKAIAWKPGFEADETGRLEFGGWVWRYDLVPAGMSQTTVTLTYDWSAATAQARQNFKFPIFGVDHLEHSLEHLAGLVSA